MIEKNGFYDLNEGEYHADPARFRHYLLHIRRRSGRKDGDRGKDEQRRLNPTMTARVRRNGLQGRLLMITSCLAGRTKFDAPFEI